MVLMNYQKVIKNLLIILSFFVIVGCKKSKNNIIDSNKLLNTWVSNKLVYIFKENDLCKSGVYDQKNNKAYLSSCTYSSCLLVK